MSLKSSLEDQQAPWSLGSWVEAKEAKVSREREKCFHAVTEQLTPQAAVSRAEERSPNF